MKYFSGFIFPNFCIKTPIILPQSNAGIGKILKIARAREINPANAR
jgi:hypothetical protein